MQLRCFPAPRSLVLKRPLDIGVFLGREHERSEALGGVGFEFGLAAGGLGFERFGSVVGDGDFEAQAAMERVIMVWKFHTDDSDTIFHPADAERIVIAEFGWQRGLRKGLPGDGATETVDGHGADGCTTSIRGGWERTAVDHAGADFHASGETIENETSGALLKDLDKRRVGGEFLLRAEEAGGELAFEAGDCGLNIREAAAHDQGSRPEHFAVQCGLI